MGRKIPKSLSGIETIASAIFHWQQLYAAKYLNPYQGLKLDRISLDILPDTLLGRKIPKSLSGIETTIKGGRTYPLPTKPQNT